MRPSTATPTRMAALIFRGKATLLQLRRAARDRAQGIARHPRTPGADFPFVLAESRSALWDENAATEAALQRGKVCNLRCALRQLHGAHRGGRDFQFLETNRARHAAARLCRGPSTARRLFDARRGRRVVPVV